MMKRILEKEVVMALGCTEPVAVSYAASAAAKAVQGEKILYISCEANGNIIKNATSVYIPNTGGLFGMKAAVAAGVISCSPELKLELLSILTDEKKERIKELVGSNMISVIPYVTDKPLYIKVRIQTESGYGLAVIEGAHDNLILVEKNGEVLFTKSGLEVTDTCSEKIDYSVLNLESIYNYVKNVSLEELRVIKKSIEVNKTICLEGLRNHYGLGTAKALNEKYLSNFLAENPMSNSIKITTAGTDARMAGCSLPAMSNAGSGNQGIATTMPVVGYGESIGASEDDITRAVALSNLVTIYIKSKLGRLSSLCGAVNASAGSSCGIVYLNSGKVDDMERAINNVMGNIAGMFCDGAKAGCGLKIATGTFVSVMSAHRALEGSGVESSDGIVGKTAEETLSNYELISKQGLKDLDRILLEIMAAK